MFVGWNTIQACYKWNRIAFGFMQKVRIFYAICGYKNKKNIFSITIIVAATLSERKNVETYLSIVNEKLLSRRYGMTVVSLQ